MMKEYIVPVCVELHGLLLVGLLPVRVLFGGSKHSVRKALVYFMEPMQLLGWKRMFAKQYVQISRWQID